MTSITRAQLTAIIGLVAASLMASTEPASATRARIALGDIVGAAGAAVLGPTYRTRRWGSTTYLQFYEPRFYDHYPLNRKLWRGPSWGRSRW